MKCGHVAVPARFYKKGRFEYATPEEAVQDHEQALEVYVEWMSENRIEWYERHLAGRPQARTVVPDNVPEAGTNVPESELSQIMSQKVCDGCYEGFQGYGRRCEKCRKRAQRAK